MILCNLRLNHNGSQGVLGSQHFSLWITIIVTSLLCYGFNCQGELLNTFHFTDPRSLAHFSLFQLRAMLERVGTLNDFSVVRKAESPKTCSLGWSIVGTKTIRVGR